jgi:antitoxin component YwqK of YwqJK toxin-antitoxin module
MASYNDTIPQVVFYYKVDKKGNQTQEKIGEAYYYDNKQEYIGGGLKDGKREGKWYAFFKDGSVQTEAFYIDGKEHGAYNIYRENGKPLFKGHYDHGICNGTWYWYDENGKQTKKVKADKNTIACEYCSKCMRLKQK